MLKHKSLTSLRGLFALAIVLVHYQCHAFDGWERCGVVFFFILSGFLLTLRHDFEKIDVPSWWSFVQRRARRVYPLHLVVWAMFMALFVAFSIPFDPATVTLNALLLQAWFPVRDIYLSVNKPIWFLSSLMFCYACFPLLRCLQHRVRLRWQVLAMVVVTPLLWWGYTLLTPGQLDFTYFFPPLRLIDFALGIVLARVFQILPADGSQSVASCTVVEVSTVLIVVMAWGVTHFTEMLATWEDALVWWLPVSMLIITLATHHGREGWVSRALSWRPLVWLGEISLEVYVLQSIVPLAFSYLVAPLFGHFGIEAYSQPILVHLVLLVVIAGLAHRFFTLPLLRRLA